MKINITYDMVLYMNLYILYILNNLGKKIGTFKSAFTHYILLKKGNIGLCIK